MYYSILNKFTCALLARRTYEDTVQRAMMETFGRCLRKLLEDILGFRV
jgi:hypothetical protein